MKTSPHSPQHQIRQRPRFVVLYPPIEQAASGTLGQEDPALFAQEISGQLFDFLTVSADFEDQAARAKELKQKTFSQRLLASKNLVICKQTVCHRDLTQGSFRDIATHARQNGVPCDVVTSNCQLNLFELRILDIQRVIQLDDCPILHLGKSE